MSYIEKLKEWNDKKKYGIKTLNILSNLDKTYLKKILRLLLVGENKGANHSKL
jgi:hypothetical protein